MSRHTDVVILGAGTAGLNARREVDKAGKDWLLVDPGPLGTTCARVGCMPSKLLIAAADAAHHARRTARFGVHTGDVRVDGPAVLARVRAERDRFAGFVVRDTLALPSDRLLRGRARLTGPTTVEVEGVGTVTADAVVIATGSSPRIPKGLDAVADKVLVNDSLFELPDLPGSVAVLGAGIIGLELGQALAHLGVDVVVLDPFDALAGIDDPAVMASARAVIGADLPLHLGSTLDAAVPDGDGVKLSWTDADGTAHTRRVDRILAAAGRVPNVADLGLHTLGVDLDRRGLPPFDPATCQVADLPVFLAGDVDQHRPLLHEAADEGSIAGANAARFPDVTPGDRRVPIAVAFTDPQIAFVGVRWKDRDCARTAVGEVDYGDQGRARVMGRNAGIGRIYADTETGRLLGATLFGPEMEHLAHLLAWAIADGLTVQDALSRPFYHPVLEEGLRTALRALSGTLGTLSSCPPADCAQGPGC
ncbi:MAG: dihydrolipoyl dehydrogenase [Alphaproteobacteria bacterium]|nr:dihydrolipoyl dehydrogenase [Alphaproteobacteria bacterium]